MNELKVFNYASNEIRVVERDGTPWFVLKDVCDVLGISNSRDTADRLYDDELASVKATSCGQARQCRHEAASHANKQRTFTAPRKAVEFLA